MTHAEALTKIEKTATALKITEDGKVYESIEAVAKIAVTIGDRWDQAENDMLSGIITADEYYARCISMMNEFDRIRWNLRVEKKIIEIRDHQNKLKIEKEGGVQSELNCGDRSGTERCDCSPEREGSTSPSVSDADDGTEEGDRRKGD